MGDGVSTKRNPSKKKREEANIPEKDLEGENRNDHSPIIVTNGNGKSKN